MLVGPGLLQFICRCEVTSELHEMHGEQPEQAVPIRANRRLRITSLFAGLVLIWFLSICPSAASNPQIPLNSTGVPATTITNNTRGTQGWTILLTGQTIATWLHPNGWSVTLKQVVGNNVLYVSVPPNAQVTTNYVVQDIVQNSLIPPSYTYYTGLFDVVANSLVLLPPTVSGTRGSTGNIVLASPVPQNGLTVTLSSNQTSATVPATVSGTPGASTINFPITTTPVSTKTVTQITASYGSVRLTANLTQLPTITAGDNPPPVWATGIVPRDSASATDFGPSAADTVNLASGVLESAPAADLSAYNSVGPVAAFSRLYRSANAANGYGSPGLSPGWTHNFDVTALSGTGQWLPIIFKYANGATETWTPQVNANGLPTGVFTLPSGTPYLATGQVDNLVPGHWLYLTLTFKDHSTWTLSADPANQTNYRLSQITNAVGHSLTIQYNGSEQVSSVSNDAQPPVPLLSFAYTGNTLSSITDAYGRTVHYTFGGSGGDSQLLSVSQINANTAYQWQYGYTLLNNWPLLSSSAQPDPTPTGDGVKMRSNSIGYGADGRVASLTDANGNIHRYSYPAATAITYLGPGGNATGNEPNFQQLSGALNNMTGTVDAANRSDQVLYADPNNPLRITGYVDRNGLTSAASYDAFGNLMQTQTPLLNGTLFTEYSYDYATFPLGNLTGVAVEANGGDYGVGYSYYPNGLVQSVSTPDPSGQNVSVSVNYTYTALGNVATVSVPAANRGGGNVTYTYNYTSDPWDGTTQNEALGEPLTVTDPNNNVTHFRWDNRGNLLAVIDGVGNRWNYSYNLADQLQNTQSPNNGSGQLQINTNYLYLNGPARQTLLLDVNSNTFRTASMTLDPEGQEAADQGDAEQDSYSYDDTGRLFHLSDAAGSSYTHQYNNVDDLTGLQYPGATAGLQFGYDHDHNLNSFTNARNQQTTYTLAADGTPVSYQRADGTQVTIGHDWIGRVNQLSDPQTILTYQYNQAGLLSLETTNYLANNGSPDTEVDYSYNADGSVSEIDTVWGSYLYTYDAGGRLTDITLPWGDPIHYDYDKANRLVHQGVIDHDTYYTYNALNQLIHQQVKGLNQSTNPFTIVVRNDYNQFNYDAAGNLLGYTWTCPQLNYNNQTPFSNTFTFNYDAQDHLIQESSNGNLYVAWSNDFGGVYSTSYNWTHQSDAADNLTQLRGVTFGNNILDQVTQDNFISGGNNYAYDADGNATTFYGSTGVYDTEGHLTTFNDAAIRWYDHAVVQAGTYTFGYRPDGRVGWRFDYTNGTTYYLYIGGRVFQEYNLSQSNNLSRTYGWGLTGLTETVTISGVAGGSADDYITTYSYDPLGSVCGRTYGDPYNHYSNGYGFDTVSLYDAFGWTRGAWTSAYDYNPLFSTGDMVGWGGAWGAETIVEPGGGMIGGAQFGAGEEGLMLLGYRFYNPDTGRFLTRDPLGYDGGINLYSYTRNNPVMNADPFGLWDALDSIQAVADIVGLIPIANIPAEIISGAISGVKGDTVGVSLSVAGLIPAVGDSSVLTKIARRGVKLINEYKELRKEARIIGQAHHLLQDAAFGSRIARKTGISINLVGDVFQKVWSEHRAAHQAMEVFWSQFRRGGTRYRELPTVSEYLDALEKSLRSAKLNKNQIGDAIHAAKRQLSQHGFKMTDRVPRIPNPINGL
jgi:RHS repeat-associated protein